MCMCDKNQAGQWQRGIATPCRSHQGDPVGAGKAALTLTDSSFFSVCLNQMPVEEGGGRPWAPPSLLMDESEGFGFGLLTLAGKEASKDKMLWPLQCWLFPWGCPQDTLSSPPGHSVVHCPIHPCYDVSLSPAQMVLSKSSSGSLCQPAKAAQAILDSQALVKMADTSQAHKGKLLP